MKNQKTHSLAFFFIIITLASMFSLYIPKSWAVTENSEVQVIPNEAIRLRILANSNSEQDQEIKRIVRDRVNAQITEWVSDLTSLEDARATIINNLDVLEAIAIEVLAEHGVDHLVQIDFDEVNFPTKLYGNFLYPAGTYEAVLITIGEGRGANWWCVLFPPLCFLDFSSGSAVSDGFEEEGKDGEAKEVVNVSSVEESKLFAAEEEETVEVKFFIVELIESILDAIKSLFQVLVD